MTTLTMDPYRRPLLDPEDALFRRCLTASAIVCALFALAALLAPLRARVIDRVEQLPPRFAKLILEPPKPAVALPAAEHVAAAQSEHALPGRPSGGGGGGGGGDEGATPRLILPEPVPTATPARGGRVAALAPGAGTAGRSRAQSEVRATLAGSGAALAQTLSGLSSSLGTIAGATAPAVGSGGRARSIRGARTEGELGAVASSIGGGSAELGSSVVVGTLVALGDGASGGHSSGTAGGSGGGSGGGYGSGSGSGIGEGSGGGMGGGTGSGVGTGNGPGTGPGSGGGGVRGPAAPGVYRSNASLLAVIQRYAAGIQYCYGNALKHEPSLRGKLVVAMTVSAAGDVVEATVVRNTVGSDRLAECALAQIREWKFPAVPEGMTVFEAPFVFTPPN